MNFIRKKNMNIEFIKASKVNVLQKKFDFGEIFQFLWT